MFLNHENMQLLNKYQLTLNFFLLPNHKMKDRLLQFVNDHFSHIDKHRFYENLKNPYLANKPPPSNFNPEQEKGEIPISFGFGASELFEELSENLTPFKGVFIFF